MRRTNEHESKPKRDIASMVDAGQDQGTLRSRPPRLMGQATDIRCAEDTGSTTTGDVQCGKINFWFLDTQAGR